MPVIRKTVWVDVDVELDDDDLLCDLSHDELLELRSRIDARLRAQEGSGYADVVSVDVDEVAERIYLAARSGNESAVVDVARRFACDWLGRVC